MKTNHYDKALEKLVSNLEKRIYFLETYCMALQTRVEDLESETLSAHKIREAEQRFKDNLSGDQ